MRRLAIRAAAARARVVSAAYCIAVMVALLVCLQPSQSRAKIDQDEPPRVYVLNPTLRSDTTHSINADGDANETVALLRLDDASNMNTLALVSNRKFAVHVFTANGLVTLKPDRQNAHVWRLDFNTAAYAHVPQFNAFWIAVQKHAASALDVYHLTQHTNYRKVPPCTDPYPLEDLAFETNAQIPEALLSTKLPPIDGRRVKRKDAKHQAGSKTASNPAFNALTIPDELDSFVTDLAARARELPPMIGRVDQFHDLLDALLGGRESNVIVLGDRGDGKTQLVHELARRLASGDISSGLVGSHIVEVNLSAIVGGTIYRGQLEERIQQLCAWAKENPNVFLFIDEIHQLEQQRELIGEQLKPHLESTKLRVIGATTFGEYQRYIEPNEALADRFRQVIRMPRMSPDEFLTILRGRVQPLGAPHGIAITGGAIRAAADLAPLQDGSPMRSARSIIESALGRAVRLEHATVTESAALRVVHRRTGIPLPFLRGDGTLAETIETDLSTRVINQEPAIQGVVASVRRAESVLGRDRVGPIGSFFFLGPSGVGKTLVAKTLATSMYGGEAGRPGEANSRLVRIDMSEYSEKHTASRLIGAPPGYIGYGEEGQLTGPVRRKKACVVLLDEVDKAHPDNLSLLLQILEDGRLTDGMGRVVDFNNAIVILTSNHGSEHFANIDPSNAEALRQAMAQHLRQALKPELLNRVDPFVFNALGRRHIDAIAAMQIDETVARLRRAMGLEVRVSDAVREAIVDDAIRKSREGQPAGMQFANQTGGDSVEPDVSFGARPVERAVKRLDDALLTEIRGYQRSRARGRKGRFPKGTTAGVVTERRDSKLEFQVEVAPPTTPRHRRAASSHQHANQPTRRRARSRAR